MTTKKITYEIDWLESILNTEAFTDEGKIEMLKMNLEIRKRENNLS